MSEEVKEIGTSTSPDNRVEVKPKKGGKIYQNIFFGLFVFLAIFFVVSIKNSNTSYRGEIKDLNKEKVELLKKLDGSVDKDSIIYYITEQGNLNTIIWQLNLEIDSLNSIVYEENIDFNFLGVDSNIAFFTRKYNEANRN